MTIIKNVKAWSVRDRNGVEWKMNVSKCECGKPLKVNPECWLLTYLLAADEYGQGFNTSATAGGMGPSVSSLPDVYLIYTISYEMWGSA